ncbi:hypothetical protein LXL04_037533 [Taraxacum kok-saghyz]
MVPILYNIGCHQSSKNSGDRCSIPTSGDLLCSAAPLLHCSASLLHFSACDISHSIVTEPVFAVITETAPNYRITEPHNYRKPRQGSLPIFIGQRVATCNVHMCNAFSKESEYENATKHNALFLDGMVSHERVKQEPSFSLVSKSICPYRTTRALEVSREIDEEVESRVDYVDVRSMKGTNFSKQVGLVFNLRDDETAKNKKFEFIPKLSSVKVPTEDGHLCNLVYKVQDIQQIYRLHFPDIKLHFVDKLHFSEQVVDGVGANEGSQQPVVVLMGTRWDGAWKFEGMEKVVGGSQRGIGKRGESGLLRVGEQLGILLFHLIFALPGKLWSALGTPSNFHNRDSTLFQPFDLPVHDLHRFFHKIYFLVYLDLIQRNDERLIRQALLEV